MDPTRILVVKLAGIGDLLTAFPALEALRLRFPRAELSALVTPASSTLLDGTGLVDRLIVLDKYLFDEPRGLLRPRTLSDLAAFAGRLRSHRFDAALLFHHLQTWSGVAKYASLMLASGAPLRAGLDDGRGIFLNRSVPDRGFGDVHEVDYWLEVVGLLDAQHPSPAVRLPWGQDECDFADRIWTGLGLNERPVVAIHPGVGSYSPVRRWSSTGFAQVGRALAEDGLVPLVVAGPGEESIARGVVEGIGSSALLLKGVPTPRHLAAVLSRCRLFIGSDSGVMHVAAAAGTPVVAVFGPSNHRAWGPYDPSGANEPGGAAGPGLLALHVPGTIPGMALRLRPDGLPATDIAGDGAGGRAGLAGATPTES